MDFVIYNILASNSFYVPLFFLGEEPDGFYEFTAEDYYRVLATRKDGNLLLFHYLS